MKDETLKKHTTVDVTKDDYEFLLGVQKFLKDQGHPVRFIWNPAPTRRDPGKIPTRVTLVAEDKDACYVQYVLYELHNEHVRKTRDEIMEQRVAEEGYKLAPLIPKSA